MACAAFGLRAELAFNDGKLGWLNQARFPLFYHSGPLRQVSRASLLTSDLRYLQGEGFQRIHSTLLLKLPVVLVNHEQRRASQLCNGQQIQSTHNQISDD